MWALNSVGIIRLIMNWYHIVCTFGTEFLILFASDQFGGKHINVSMLWPLVTLSELLEFLLLYIQILSYPGSLSLTCSNARSIAAWCLLTFSFLWEAVLWWMPLLDVSVFTQLLLYGMKKMQVLGYFSWKKWCHISYFSLFPIVFLSSIDKNYALVGSVLCSQHPHHPPPIGLCTMTLLPWIYLATVTLRI